MQTQTHHDHLTESKYLEQMREMVLRVTSSLDCIIFLFVLGCVAHVAGVLMLTSLLAARQEMAESIWLRLPEYICLVE